MNVTYEHKNKLTFIGFHTEIAPDEDYCKYCYANGEFTDKVSMEYIEMCNQFDAQLGTESLALL